MRVKHINCGAVGTNIPGRCDEVTVIERDWFHRGQFSRDHVVPDGCIAVVLNFHAQFKQQHPTRASLRIRIS